MARRRSVAARGFRGGLSGLRHARRPRADPPDRLQRIVELEILDALGFQFLRGRGEARVGLLILYEQPVVDLFLVDQVAAQVAFAERSEEHTSELQSLMRISYAVLCLKKKTKNKQKTDRTNM